MLSATVGCPSTQVNPNQPKYWCKPTSVTGVINVYTMVPGVLYKGGQPSAEGFRQLAKMGVKTVISVRTTFDDRFTIGGMSGLDYEPLAEHPLLPTYGNAVRFVQITSDTSRAPFYIHCLRGAERSGLYCAIFRVVYQGWTKDEAIDEMWHGGSGFWSFWGQPIMNFIRELDVEKLKQDAGVTDEVVRFYRSRAKGPVYADVPTAVEAKRP